MAQSQDLAPANIGPIVLALLDDRPMYGYEIVKVVNARTNGLFEWKEGTLYPALHRLESDRFVKSQWMTKARDKRGVGAEGGAIKRKYYAITAKGKKRLASHREQWGVYSQAVNTLLLGS